MKKSNVNEKIDNNFNSPELPIKWIASTFIAPALTFIIPYLLTAGETSISTLVIIALILLSLLLFVLFLSTILRLYNESYARQVTDLKLEILRKDADMMAEQTKKNISELAKLQTNLK